MRQMSGEQAGSVGIRRVARWRLHFPVPLLAFAALIPLLLAACGASTPASPPVALGGSYTNAAFHFSLTYPAGWQVTELPTPTEPASAGGVPIPLTVVVSRTSSTQSSSPIVSNLTVAILDLRNPTAINSSLLKTVTSRASNSAYHSVTLAGHTAYATQPEQQQILGTQQVDTHTDYYLDTTSFEYHLSTDVLANDSADSAVTSILASFTLTA